MKFSYNAVWEDTVRTLRANSSLLIAVAGVFLFLPTVVAGYLSPPRTAETFPAMIEHLKSNWLLMLTVNIIGFVGNLALLILALDINRPTVGTAIRAALALLPIYFLVSILSGFMIGLGFLLLIIPGLYLIGRLSVTGAVLVAEERRNPFDIIKRSFEVTKGRGWAILGLILLVFLAFYVITLAITFILGSIFLLADKAAGAGGIGAFLLLILTSAVGAAFNIVLMVLVASIYRRVTGESAAEAVV